MLCVILIKKNYFVIKLKVMSVISNIQNEKLILELDNGDKKIFLEMLQKWNFKDEESLVRFALSVLKLSKDCAMTINTAEEGEIKIKPADNFVKNK